jgi:hypothetical protein
MAAIDGVHQHREVTVALKLLEHRGTVAGASDPDGYGRACGRFAARPCPGAVGRAGVQGTVGRGRGSRWLQARMAGHGRSLLDGRGRSWSGWARGTWARARLARSARWGRAARAARSAARVGAGSRASVAGAATGPRSAWGS